MLVVCRLSLRVVCCSLFGYGRRVWCVVRCAMWCFIVGCVCVVVCCLLGVGYCVLCVVFIVCCFIVVDCCLVVVGRCVFVVAGCPSLCVYRLVFVRCLCNIRCLLIDVCCLLLGDCCLLLVVVVCCRPLLFAV